MSREWKPGDVAIARVQGEEGTFVMRRTSPIYPWTTCDWTPGERWCFEDAEVGDVRPLVVIDPEDREQVERLALTLRDHKGWCGGVVREATDAMQAALRSLIAPTKPEEPQGLGAVVEDEGGVPWVRCENADREPHWYARNKMRAYADITAVRVLSKGVTQ